MTNHVSRSEENVGNRYLIVGPAKYVSLGIAIVFYVAIFLIISVFAQSFLLFALIIWTLIGIPVAIGVRILSASLINKTRKGKDLKVIEDQP